MSKKNIYKNIYGKEKFKNVQFYRFQKEKALILILKGRILAITWKLRHNFK